MRQTRYASLVFGLMLLSGLLGLWGQGQKHGPNLAAARLPAWPADGVLRPPLPGNHYVFYDAAAQEYVVRFPERLGLGGDDGGEIIQFRFQPQFVVEPTVAATVSKGKDDVFEYGYSITNGPTAKDAIRWFSVVVPMSGEPPVLQHPTWISYGPNMSGAPFAPQAALFEGPDLRKPANMGTFAGWTSSNKAPPINPGNTVAGFRIESKLLPGITTAYFQTGIVLHTPVELPPPVHDQVAPLLIPENAYRAVATIGPKFLASHGTAESPEAVARDFQRCIQRLVRDGRISTDSAFAKEAAKLLEQSAVAGACRPIRFQSVPKSSLEHEIANAVQLSLRCVSTKN